MQSGTSAARIETRRSRPYAWVVRRVAAVRKIAGAPLLAAFGRGRADAGVCRVGVEPGGTRVGLPLGRRPHRTFSCCGLRICERIRVWRLRASKRGISPVLSVSESSDTDPEAHLRAILSGADCSEADCAFTHSSDPTTLTATSE